MNRITAVVMTKYPQPGRVKTRLMPTLSAEQAAAVHQAFLLFWVERLTRAGFGDVVICFDPPDAEAAFRLLLLPQSSRVQFIAQSAGDLGARLASAAERLFHETDRLLLFGVDSPDVPRSHLEAVCDALDSAAGPAVVIAPTVDGGFWTIGLRRGVHARRLFDGIEWSSGREFEQTVRRAESLGYTVHSPSDAAWEDVDHPADLGKLLTRLSRQGASDDTALYNALSFVPREKLI